MSTEDTEARQQAISFLDNCTPMALENLSRELPPEPENPKPARKRRTPEEIAAGKAARAAERERAKLERAQARVRAKEQARLAKITEAEGGRVELPAVVLRDGTVRPVHPVTALEIGETYLDALCLDVETSGYWVGHNRYELRTVQLGGEEMAVVLDAADERQMAVASYLLQAARKLHAHSATADVVPCVVHGLIGWDDAWGKMHDSVIYAKLIDPHMSGSEANGLKDLAHDLLREYAVSPSAEKEKNALFQAMGCLLETDNTTPPDKIGWNVVSKNSVVMTRYAGSDVLDLAAIMRVMPPLPVDESVLDREREFQAMCAQVAMDGFRLDPGHIKIKVAEHEEGFAVTQANVKKLSQGVITNPGSPKVVIQYLKETFPGIDLSVKDKVTKKLKDSAGKDVLNRIKAAMSDPEENPLLWYLCDQIGKYRKHQTALGLILRPLADLCENGDGRMRPTVFTINAVTGRCSCVRPNGQQMSRQGGIRACVIGDD